ncbi:MAG: putative nuclease [Acidimicrobiales bacterium]|nr:putative nuclease [Acidimicrobiales bacterium]
MKLWPGWLVVLAAACGSGTRAAPETTTLNLIETNATVVRVIDGDTIDADIHGTTERVRLIGIDTPETKKPNTPVQCYGPEASGFTKHTLPAGTSVLIVRDIEARDIYGRLLGYVYRSRDGLFVNLELAVEGYARVLTIRPNDAHVAEFVQAARVAEATDLGLWGACSG